MGAHTQTVVDRVKAGKAVKPSELADAMAADRLDSLRAELVAEDEARQAQDDRAARHEAAIVAFAQEADEAGDELLRLIDAHDAALEALKAACKSYEEMPSRYGREIHESGGRLDSLNVFGWSGQRVCWEIGALHPAKLDVPATGYGLRSWLEHRRAERAERYGE